MDLSPSRLKLCVSGGGAIAADTQSWVRTVMCPVMIQGYGLTETNAASVLQDPTDTRNSVVGRPLSSVELKLVDCVDPLHAAPVYNNLGKCLNANALDSTGLPYLATDTQHSMNTSSGIVSEPCLPNTRLTAPTGDVLVQVIVANTNRLHIRKDRGDLCNIIQRRTLAAHRST